MSTQLVTLIHLPLMNLKGSSWGLRLCRVKWSSEKAMFIGKIRFSRWMLRPSLQYASPG